MKIKGIKRGQIIELVEAIDIPDGTEVSVEIDDRQLLTPEERQKRLEAFFNTPRDEAAIEDLATTLATMEAEEREMLELYYGSRDDQVADSTRPLVSFIGATKGSFANPEEVDQFIRQERDAWES
jgi:antitoxin component of MazEF toxin-antitoxin module